MFRSLRLELLVRIQMPSSPTSCLKTSNVFIRIQPPGTLLISAAGSIGRVVEYQGEKAYFQDSNIVWLEHDHRLNDAFLKPLYSRIEWGLEGSTIKRLYNKDLLSAEVTVPGGREQEEIGQFFAKLDNLITLHQRKYCGVASWMLGAALVRLGSESDGAFGEMKHVLR